MEEYFRVLNFLLSFLLPVVLHSLKWHHMSLEDLEYSAQVVWTTFIVLFNVFVPGKACNIQIVSSVVEYVKYWFIDLCPSYLKEFLGLKQREQQNM